MGAKVLGFTGRAGSGKSFCAEQLARIISDGFEMPVTLASLATPIKELAQHLGWNGQKDAKGRRLLQLLGTEVGRDCISKDIWVNVLESERQELADPVTLIVDDVRFENEAQWVREFGVMFHVARKGDPHLTGSASQHESEAGVMLKGPDRIIFNDDANINLLRETLTAYYKEFAGLEGAE